MFRSLSAYFEYAKSAGVSMLQAYALTFIHYNGPCRMSDLGENLMMSAAAVSQLVDRLEKQSLVKRIAERGDRRVRNVALSGRGETFVKQSIQARQSWVKEIPAEWSDERLDRISDALQLLTSIDLPPKK